MTEKGKSDLAKAEELDEMDKTLSSDNADLLEKVLKTLKGGGKLRPKDQAKLEALYDKHFGEHDEEEKTEAADDDDIDEDDFV